MDLTPKQQASEAIRQAGAILIVTGQRPNIDQVSSVVAISLILRKFGKKVTTLISDQLPSSVNFIAQDQVERGLTGLRDFIVKVDLGHAEVDKLKYTIEDGKLNIHVIPFKGGFSQQDVSFSHGDYHYDLIIAMGVPSRLKLDRILEQNPALMNSTPLLNLDYHRINENYGAINLIDTNAATLSEMLISLAESLQAGLLDDQIATAMLTGIIASTDRFTAPHTTAKSMTVAAQLMAGGARQQAIIKALYSQRDNRDSRDSHNRDNRDSRDNRDNRERRPDSSSSSPPPVAAAPSPTSPPAQPQSPQPQTQTQAQPQAQPKKAPDTQIEPPAAALTVEPPSGGQTSPAEGPSPDWRQSSPSSPDQDNSPGPSAIDWSTVMPSVADNVAGSPDLRPANDNQPKPGSDSDISGGGVDRLSASREAGFSPKHT